MRRLLHLIDEVGLGWLVAALAAAVVLFGLAFWGLANAGPGYLVLVGSPGTRASFWDALYFSVVTISSLGYGDIVPIGPARILVAIEVSVGLAFVGVLIAKISSVKQDYILKRMYSDEVADKLDHYAHALQEQRTLYRTTCQLLLDGEIDPELTTTFRRDTPGATFFSAFRQLLSDVDTLLRTEAHNGVLFGEVPDSSIEGVYDAIRGMLRRTTLVWEKDTDGACDLIFRGNADELSTILSLAEDIGRLGRRGSRNPDIIAISDAILELSARIRGEILPRI